MLSRAHWLTGQDGRQRLARLSDSVWRSAHKACRRARSACSTMPHLRARLLLIASLAVTLAVPTPAHAAKQVGYPALLHQIQSGPLIRAIINRKAGHIEIKFRDLSEWEASYPRGAQPYLQRLLH